MHNFDTTEENLITTSANVFIHGLIGSIKDKSDENKKMVFLRLATKKKDITMWHNIVCYGITAENALLYLKVGNEISVNGNLEFWQDDEGNTSTSYTIKANYISYRSDAFVDLYGVLVDINKDEDDDECYPLYLTVLTYRKRKIKKEKEDELEEDELLTINNKDYHKVILNNKEMCEIFLKEEKNLIGQKLMINGSLYVDVIPIENINYDENNDNDEKQTYNKEFSYIKARSVKII